MEELVYALELFILNASFFVSLCIMWSFIVSVFKFKLVSGQWGGFQVIFFM
jgi:hypothetical protein